MESGNFYSHGKLLLTAEYLVLDGAIALAVPVKLGQSLQVSESDAKGLHWTAYQPGGKWFEAKFDLSGFTILESTQPQTALVLKNYLQAIRNLQTGFLAEGKNFDVNTHLEFNINWGLGSSSTLVANLANWAGIDPFALHRAVSKGSGYDIACAGASGPLLYQLSGEDAIIKPVQFNPSFRNSLYFVYLGKKQDSNAGITSYRKKTINAEKDIAHVNRITENILNAGCLNEFGLLMDEHEAVLSKILGISPLRETLFKNVSCSVKSLGAWGGDFAMLATDIGMEELQKQLAALGLETFFCFEQLLIQPSDTKSL